MRVVRGERHAEMRRSERVEVPQTLLERGREVVHLGMGRLAFGVLEEEQNAPFLGMAHRPLQPLQPGLPAHPVVAGEVIAGMHDHPARDSAYCIQLTQVLFDAGQQPPKPPEDTDDSLPTGAAASARC
jgi:hypothetical protein